MKDWLVEFNNGKTYAIRAASVQDAIVKAIDKLTRATRVKAVHQIA